jgi:acetyl-CoA/propionyl-CoA carboxylase biotin carboxyl carrier protein
VARTEEEIPAMFDAAVREAVAAFGRGECFVERYLDRPRHVETQCLADVHGHVVVISTRDCSLQRRHQKLVEEAPAPFLDAQQTTALYAASKNILRAAGYVGAGTCEFLVGHDGTLSFLEVNTRLQVEHPVSEEVTGVDLVLEQFRIADGEPLGYDDPAPRGHSIEFRINGEDPGRDFLPAPGRVTTWLPPSGPGVRVDSGVEAGSSVPQAFDSLLAKLIVTGADRAQTLQRARRALAEFRVEGMPTALPFHRAVVDDPAFAPAEYTAPFSVHTRWIETEFVNEIPPYQEAGAVDDQPGREVVTVEVAGKRLEVTLPADLGQQRTPGTPNTSRLRRRAASHAPGGHAGDELHAPMQGTIVKVAVHDGQLVEAGDLVVVLEAMKMEQPLTAHRSGTVTGLQAKLGEQLAGGAVICEIRSDEAVVSDAD